MLHNEATSQTTDVLDCQGDNNSCISKEDDTVVIGSDHIGGAEENNVTFSGSSVSSACPDAVEKSLNGQSIRIRSLADQISVEDCGKNSTGARKDSGETAFPTAPFRDESETPLREDCDGLGHKISEKPCILANTETGSSDEYPSATVLNNFDGNESLKPNIPITSTHIMHGNESEELVDVRVCDICGDVGREAFLALCSKCSDGAEHIYCMSPKMDKLPESDWLCEECTLMRDPKVQRQATMEGSDKPSCSKEPSKNLLAKSSVVQHVGNMTNNHLSEASSLSDKRLGSAINTTSAIKKRTIARSVQSPKVGSGVKTRSTHVSSLMNMDKGKDAARQVSSLVDLPAKKVVKQTCSSGDRSPKPEQQFCGGSVKNGNPANSSASNIEVQRSRNICQRSSAKENAYGEVKKGRSDRKVFKSLPQTGGSSISMDVSTPRSSVSPMKNLRCKSGRNSNKTRHLVANKTIQLDLAVSGSSPMKVSSFRTNVVSKAFKAATSSERSVKDNKAVQVDGNTHGKALGSPINEGKYCMNTLVAGSAEGKKSPCNSSYVVSPSAEIGNVSRDQRVNVEVDNLAKDKDDHFVASFDSKCLKPMPKLDAKDIDHLAPAVPESRCIWKGTFRLERSGELPIDCYGVQAHLSTSASSKVVELVHKFSPEMLLKKVPRSHTWPIQFQKNHPTEQDIALYFFAQDLWSYGRSYKLLLESMIDRDLVLEADFGDFQLLAFPSSLLPARSQRWNSLPFLWGVFKKRKVDDHVLPSPSFIDTAEQGPESAGDHNIDHELPLLEENIGILQRRDSEADAVTFTHAWRNEDSGGSLHSNDLQKRARFPDEDIESISKTDIIRGNQYARGYPESIGFGSGVYKGPRFPLVYDSAPEHWQRHDVASGSSFSLDSGPSASSDGGWGIKSAEELQVEPLRSCTDLNLDLCLGNRSVSEPAVDLDLVLGLPIKYAYQPKNSFKDGSYSGEDVSLVLSLGMPCSTR